MEEEKDGAGGGTGGAVEDVGAGGEGEVVDFDGGAGHDAFLLSGVRWGWLVPLGVLFSLRL